MKFLVVVKPLSVHHQVSALIFIAFRVNFWQDPTVELIQILWVRTIPLFRVDIHTRLVGSDKSDYLEINGTKIGIVLSKKTLYSSDVKNTSENLGFVKIFWLWNLSLNGWGKSSGDDFVVGYNLTDVSIDHNVDDNHIY